MRLNLFLTVNIVNAKLMYLSIVVLTLFDLKSFKLSNLKRFVCLPAGHQKAKVKHVFF